MTLAQLANVKPRVVQILNANQDAWSPNVSGDVGAFPHDAEITAAILEADEYIVTRGYFPSVNNTLAEKFMTLSANIPHGENVPFHYGNHGKVEVSGDGIDWKIAVEAESLDDVLNAKDLGGYVSANAFNHLFKIHNGVFYHPATYGRIEIPLFTRTTVLQANQSEETLIFFTTIKFLTKNASPAPFEFYTRQSDLGVQSLVTDGSYNPDGDANK